MREQLRELLKGYEPAVQKVITRVLLVEQEHIHLERPKVADQIQKIVESVAKQYPEPEKDENDEAR